MTKSFRKTPGLSKGPEERGAPWGAAEARVEQGGVGVRPQFGEQETQGRSTAASGKGASACLGDSAGFPGGDGHVQGTRRLPLHLPLPGTAGWPWGTPSPSSRQQRRCDTAETSPWVPVLLGTQPRFHPAAWGAGGGGALASSGRPQPPPSARLAPRARGHCRFRLPSFLRSLFWLR